MTELPHLSTTRAAYDAVAAVYTERFDTELQRKPLDRAMLAAFAELVRTGGSGPVADLGCGPGRATAHLHSHGLAVFGVDLSPEMVALARQAQPDLRFDEGSMTALDLADGTLGGIVARYSIIHTPPELLPEVFAEFHRVLAPGGHLLLAFLATDEPLQSAQSFDHKVALLPMGTRRHRRDAPPGRVHRGRPAAARARRHRAVPPGPPPGLQDRGVVADGSCGLPGRRA